MNKQQNKSQLQDNKKTNLWHALTTKEEEKISGGINARRITFDPRMIRSRAGRM